MHASHAIWLYSHDATPIFKKKLTLELVYIYLLYDMFIVLFNYGLCKLHRQFMKSCFYVRTLQKLPSKFYTCINFTRRGWAHVYWPKSYHSSGQNIFCNNLSRLASDTNCKEMVWLSWNGCGYLETQKSAMDGFVALHDSSSILPQLYVLSNPGFNPPKQEPSRQLLMQISWHPET